MSLFRSLSAACRRWGAGAAMVVVLGRGAAADGPLEDVEVVGPPAAMKIDRQDCPATACTLQQECQECPAGARATEVVLSTQGCPGCTQAAGVALTASASPTELEVLLGELADRVEILKAKVDGVSRCASLQRGPDVSALTGTAAPSCSSVTKASCGSSELAAADPAGPTQRVDLVSKVDLTVDPSQGVDLVSKVEPADSDTLLRLDEAEARLASVQARIDELEVREGEIVREIENKLARADTARGEIVRAIEVRTATLTEIWERQQGAVDVAALAEGARDAMLASSLPELLRAIVQFSENFDQIADLGLQPLLEEWSMATDQMNLGAGFLARGQQFEGVTLGMVLLGVADQIEGVPMPPKIAEALAMAQQFGVANFLPLLKSQLVDVNAGALFAPLAVQFDGVRASVFLDGYADQVPGEVLSSLAIGIGDAFEGVDIGAVFRVLVEELEPVSARALLMGVDKALRGEPPSVILRSVGEKLTDVDLGRMFTRLGRSLEEASVSNVLFRMSAELDGITVADALAEAQMGLNAMGVPLELADSLRHSGEHIARLDLPRKIEGVEGMVSQLASFTDSVRRELGLHPYGQVEFEIVDPVIEAVVDVADASSREEAAAEQSAAIRRLEIQLQDLRAAGLPEDHPALQKVRARLEEALSRSGG